MLLDTSQYTWSVQTVVPKSKILENYNAILLLTIISAIVLYLLVRLDGSPHLVLNVDIDFMTISGEAAWLGAGGIP